MKALPTYCSQFIKLEKGKLSCPSLKVKDWLAANPSTHSNNYETQSYWVNEKHAAHHVMTNDLCPFFMAGWIGKLKKLPLLYYLDLELLIQMHAFFFLYMPHLLHQTYIAFQMSLTCWVKFKPNFFLCPNLTPMPYSVLCRQCQ